ncbi:SDR family oxidoreductase [bacterium]|nr:SDR family oxidoreductase [bacterium]
MSIKFDFCQSSFLVTGASSGIGLDVCEQLDRAGARLVLVARDTERLETVVTGLEGRNHIIAPVDLSIPEGLDGWLVQRAAAVGGLNGIVHCAGIMGAKPLRGLVSSDWERAWNINVVAGAMLAKGFRKKNVHRENASFVFVSSVMGMVGQAGQIVYSATKGALISMAKSMALELARDNIRVNCVAPAAVMAGMTLDLERNIPEEQMDAIKRMHPLGLGECSDVSNAILYLLACESKWITGTTLMIDGGYTAH